MNLFSDYLLSEFDERLKYFSKSFLKLLFVLKKYLSLRKTPVLHHVAFVIYHIKFILQQLINS
jgi:hypothetical protein